MNGEQSQAAIARALGLAKSRVTAMKKQGMPVHSIEAAQEWRRRHVAPIMRSTRRDARAQMPEAARPDRTDMPTEYPAELADMPQPLQHFLRLCFDPEAALKHAAALGELATEAIGPGTFFAIEPALRMALSAVPVAYRHRLPALPLKVWDALCADVFALCGVDMENLGDAPTLIDPEEIEYMGAFWYQVAAGEIRPTP